MGMRALRIATWPGCAALLLVFFTGPLPAQSQAEGKIFWSYTAGSIVDSSPAVAVGSDGKVVIYAGAEDLTNPRQGRLVALNPDGSDKWPAPGRTFETLDKTNPVDSGVFSAPTIGADGTIYFGCDNGKLFALNPNLSEQWELPVGSPIGSSPALGPDGTIYVMSVDFVLHAISPTNHTEMWRRSSGSGVNGFEASPAVAADGTIYFASADGDIFALRPDNSEKWPHIAAGVLVYSSPAIVSDGTVYFTSYTDGRLLAVSPDGVIKWTFQASGVIAASPVTAADGTIYFGDGNGVFYAVNPDGSPKWPNPPNIGVPILSTAAVRADGTIIFGAHDHFLHALNPDGSEKWKTELKKPQRDGDVILSSPVIAPDGTIYVGSEDGNVYAVYGNGSPLSTFAGWPMLHHDVTHTARAQAATTGGFLINLSTLAQAGGSSPLIVGFVIQGQTPKRFLIRAVGPTLGAAPFNVPNMLADPAVSVVFAPTGAEVASNNDWSDPDHQDNFLQVTAFTSNTFSLQAGFKDAAVAPSLPPGRYSAVVKPTDGGTGLALVEVYDAEVASSGSRLINLSTRAQSGSGAGVLTAGLVVGGQGTLRVLLRAIGPGLAQFGVDGFLARPSMLVFDSSSKPIGGNTGWTSGGLTEDLAAAARLTGAFPLSPIGAGSADCAAVVTLVPGNYTIQASGLGGTTGEALVEVYAVP